MSSRAGSVLALTLVLAVSAACSNSTSGLGARPATPGLTHATTPSRVPAQSPASAPCSGTPTPPAGQRLVIWIFMENKESASIVGSRNAPYINTLATECGLATNYQAVTHPSLPNYLAATGGSTAGVHSDCSPGDCPVRGRSIFQQLQDAGQSWRSYEESMPSNCAQSSTDGYATKHNPAAYYTAIRERCRQWDVPLGSPQTGPLATALRDGTLPAFSFVTPNICHDMHDCSVSTGDRWLREWIPLITGMPDYRSGRTVVFLTWDEAEGGSDSNHVACLVLAASVPMGLRVGDDFGHYSLLRTTEELLSLPLLGKAASARSMRAAFHL